MGWPWWRSQQRTGSGALGAWKAAWLAAARSLQPDERSLRDLEQQLEALAPVHEDLEVEREMLDALRQLAELARAVAAAGLPLVETRHRVVTGERCHFIAPVSMPDDPSQPSGRLLLTHARAVFVGGARPASITWHAVSQVVQAERDLVLVGRDAGTLFRFRCNTFGDALRGAYLARRLSGPAASPSR